MTIKKILKLGNPVLYKYSTDADNKDHQLIKQTFEDLKDTMSDFRKKYNCGRAIAAPQIGVSKRLIYMNLEGKETFFINPEIIDKSDEKYVLWDDCMSFPDLLVKVERHKSISVRYFNLEWKEQIIYFDNDLSELFQHEFDHLDGVLATMRAIDNKSIIYKSEYDDFKNKDNKRE